MENEKYKAELKFLAILINDPEQIKEAKTAIGDPSTIKNNQHRVIYKALLNMFYNGVSIEDMSIISELRTQGLLKQAGGGNKLAELAEMDTSGLATYYAKEIIFNNAALAAASLGGTMRDDFNKYINGEGGREDQPFSFTEHIDNALSELRNIQNAICIEKQMVTVKDAMPDVRKEILEAMSDSGTVTLKTGINDFDKQIGGISRGEYSVIAARPSVGKSSLALNIALNTAKNKHKVALFSLEVPIISVIKDRLLQIESGVSMSQLKHDGSMTEKDFNKCDQGIARFCMLDNIRINANPNLNISDLESIARSEHQQNKFDLIIVDYVQLVRNPGAFTSRERQVADVSIRLKALIQELDVYSLLLYQVNRGSEKGERPPRNSDLRESGQIEMDADMIIMLHEDDQLRESDKIKLEVTKNKNGTRCKMDAYFNRQFTSFQEPTQEDFYEN